MFHTVVLLLFLSSLLLARDKGMGELTAPYPPLAPRSDAADDPRMSGCGEADAFEADIFEVQGDNYVAVITDGKGIIPNGTLSAAVGAAE
jgi:hypothetical protein